jgi:Tol biopolymer transport system component
MALWRMRPDGRGAVRVTTGTGPESQPTVSGDGRKLAYSTHAWDHDLVVLDTATGERIEIRGGLDEWQVALAPDKSFFIFVSNRWGPRFELGLQPLDEDGRPSGPSRRITDFPGDASHPAVSPDGRWVAYYRILDGQRDILVMPSSGGSPVRFTEHAAVDIQPAWSPDGSRLAFVSERDGGSRIWVAPVEEGRRTGDPKRVTPDSILALSPSWSPDGKTLAFIGSSGGDGEAWIVPAGGGAPPRALTRGASAKRLRWHGPTGDLLVSGAWGSNTLTLQRVSTGDGSRSPFEPPVVFGGETAFANFDVSPDGGLLVFSKQNLRGNIWVLQTTEGTY